MKYPMKIFRLTESFSGNRTATMLNGSSKRHKFPGEVDFIGFMEVKKLLLQDEI